MASSDQSQILVLRPGIHEAFDIASEMEKDAAPVTYRQEWHFDVLQIVVFACVVLIIKKLVLDVVDVLVVAVCA